MDNIVLGIDIGGSHITAGLIDLDDKILLQGSYIRKIINSSDSSDNILSLWANTINEVFEKSFLPIGKIGIAMPGPFDYVNGISFIKNLAKYDHLYGINVKDILSQKLSIDNSQIKMINDASAFLCGEILNGAAVNITNVVGVTLGTGLGSASYYNEKLEDGNLYCESFQEGNAEDYLSARWVLSEYEKSSLKKIKGVKEIADLFDFDENAQQVFQTFGENLGIILFDKYSVQNPSKIIIGGNISKAHTRFFPSAQIKLAEKGCSSILVPSVLGENAALFGAASLWR